MRRAVAAVGAGMATLATYERWVKPWQQRWGATAEEVSAALPGDDLTAEPASQVTRALTVAAPPGDVWPWLVQLGADRAGFYSYDWLENLFGLGIHSASEVVPEWRQVAVGDVVYADRARTGGWTVVDVVPGEAVVMKAADLR